MIPLLIVRLDYKPTYKSGAPSCSHCWRAGSAAWFCRKHLFCLAIWRPGYFFGVNFCRELRFFIPECVARVPVSLWGSGGWGCVRSTLRSRAQPFATVRANSVWPCLWEVLQRWSFLGVSDVWLLRFAWQAWHFVTFRRVLQRVESRFAWQAQYFCDVFRRCVAVFVAGAALWACPSSFFVAGAAL